MKKDYDNIRKVIDEIKNKVDIVDFVNSYLSLNKKGKNYSALCPFHTEDTPSFYIFPDTQTFHCFGCGAHGDVITFLEKYEQISFLEALKKLGSYAGITVELNQNSVPDEILLNEEVSKLYTNTLLNLPSYSSVWKYLNKRGIDKDLVEEFELGFANGNEVKKVLEENMFDKQIAINNRLILEDKEFFYNRLIIPIRDNSGLLVGFSGRLINENENLPKYINSSENRFFKKSKILYMYYKTKKFIKENDFAIIVEGYFDVISLYKLGFKNTTAILGSSFTKDHALDILKSTNKIITMYDMDEAGKKATLSTIEALYSKDFQIAVAKYPAKDPDELVKKKDKSYIAEILKTSYKFHEFIVDYYAEKYDLSNDFGLEKFLQEMTIWYKKFENAGRLSYLNSFLEVVSEKTLKDKNYIQKIFERASNFINKEPLGLKKNDSFLANNQLSLEKGIRYDIAKSYLYLWIKYPQYQNILKDFFNEKDFQDSVIKEFLKLMEENNNLGFILENASPELSNLITEIWKIDYYFDPERILSSLKESIKRFRINRQIEELKNKLHMAEEPSEKTQIVSQIISLYSKLKTIN
ncbi:DNA primase [Petrotoga sp. 9PWA.NaAc.5.4]|uniref:DNA primase n=1 Tax=Petrotoga sp. 9PWA.NaAc.5.4 TaxID=1434328 RepID=UPI000EFD9F3C|nr:DNA primase [Petrotoga sp. 9PWA.NaAc.5.4]